MARNVEYGPGQQIGGKAVNRRCSSRRERRSLRRSRPRRSVLPSGDRPCGLSGGTAQPERRGNATLEGVREELGYLLMTFLTADSEENRSRALGVLEQTLQKYVYLRNVDR